VIVENDKIKVSQRAAESPRGAGDHRTSADIPAFRDDRFAHAHDVLLERRPRTTPLRQPPRPRCVTVFLGQENAKKTLEAGVTAVRGFEPRPGGADIAMRDLINMGAMIGRECLCRSGLRSYANPSWSNGSGGGSRETS